MSNINQAISHIVLDLGFTYREKPGAQTLEMAGGLVYENEDGWEIHLLHNTKDIDVTDSRWDEVLIKIENAEYKIDVHTILQVQEISYENGGIILLS